MWWACTPSFRCLPWPPHGHLISFTSSRINFAGWALALGVDLRLRTTAAISQPRTHSKPTGFHS